MHPTPILLFLTSSFWPSDQVADIWNFGSTVRSGTSHRTSLSPHFLTRKRWLLPHRPVQVQCYLNSSLLMSFTWRGLRRRAGSPCWFSGSAPSSACRPHPQLLGLPCFSRRLPLATKAHLTHPCERLYMLRINTPSPPNRTHFTRDGRSWCKHAPGHLRII